MENEQVNSNSPLEEIKKGISVLIKEKSAVEHELDDYRNSVDNNTKKMLLSFIEIADTMENLFRRIDPKLEQADKTTKNWVSGFHTIYRMLQKNLARWDVIPIEVVIGEKANPYWHDVVEVVERLDRENETIIEEVKKGYMWNHKLLRAAEVKAVSNNN